MRAPKAALGVAAAVVALALMLAACGGGDDEETTTNPAPSSGVPPPSGDAAPPSAAALPPGIAECLADQGIDIEGADINEILHGGAVPPQVLNNCFEALHQGGGVP